MRILRECVLRILALALVVVLRGWVLLRVWELGVCCLRGGSLYVWVLGVGRLLLLLLHSWALRVRTLCWLALHVGGCSVLALHARTLCDWVLRIRGLRVLALRIWDLLLLLHVRVLHVGILRVEVLLRLRSLRLLHLFLLHTGGVVVSLCSSCGETWWVLRREEMLLTSYDFSVNVDDQYRKAGGVHGNHVHGVVTFLRC